MIDIHLHWAWLLVAAVVIIGVCCAYPFLNKDDGIGFNGTVGCIIIVLAVLVALVLGGIFIW